MSIQNFLKDCVAVGAIDGYLQALAKQQIALEKTNR
jgi:hypothetical protein